MSRVLLIAADHPLPLWDKQEERTCTVTLSDLPKLGEDAGKTVSVTALRGFRVVEHAYYRSAVDDLGYPIKPHRYELELDFCPEDLEHLRAYLSANLAPGDEIELWNLWLGMDQEAKPVHFRGSLADFDLDTLAQFLNLPMKDGLMGQCRMTVAL